VLILESRSASVSEPGWEGILARVRNGVGVTSKGVIPQDQYYRGGCIKKNKQVGVPSMMKNDDNKTQGRNCYVLIQYTLMMTPAFLLCCLKNRNFTRMEESSASLASPRISRFSGFQRGKRYHDVSRVARKISDTGPTERCSRSKFVTFLPPGRP
jgi:hypothetical protein